MFTEIGKAKGKFAEMCKSWSAFNRSKVCCTSVYAHTRKASYQQRVTEDNLCGCCEELLITLKTKKIYWIELKKSLFPPNLFSIKVNIAHSVLNIQEGWKVFRKSESKYGDLLPHSEVCWTSKGKILSRFIACIDEIQIFWPKLEKLIYCSIMKPDRYDCGC